MKDALGDRMKMYERVEADRHVLPLLPVLARIDGRAFHNFTRGMDRPFDRVFSSAMIDTTKFLVSETGACMGYTQSDEITLAWLSTDIKSQIFFNGRISKMVSQVAALATLYFYRLVVERMPAYANRLPTFDARVWQVPNLTEGANVFIWREWDATKNSLNMAAAQYFSPRELHGKNSAAKHSMLFDLKGVNWDHYPTHFKRGTYVQRRIVQAPFTTEEIERLPPKHAARTNPQLIVERSHCTLLEMPPLSAVLNRQAVIFMGEEPFHGRGDSK